MSRKLPPNAFAYYLELGVARSYEAVAKEFSCSKRTVTNHAKKDRWQERLAEAERARTKKAEEKAIETLEAMDERQLKVLRFIQAKSIEALRSMPLDSAMDAVRAFTISIEKERLIRGEPSERTAIDIEKKIREEHDRWLVPVTTTEAPSDSTAETQTQTAVATEPAPEVAAPKKGKKASKLSGTATLADLAAGYLAHMESEGKSDGTISSYRMELKTAAAELGEDTLVADVTPERVQEFFDCKRVTKLRSGKAKAKPSIDKTRRVLRLALVWGEERGIVKKAPLPEPVPAQ